HTAYILTSLSRIMDSSQVGKGGLPPQLPQNWKRREQAALPDLGGSESRPDLQSALQRGYDFWQERFFLANGWPKYFPERLYPADVHSAATAIVALVELRGRIPSAMILADKVAAWTIENLRDSSGLFYYQRRRFYRVRIPYLRWSEAWMMYALARLAEGQNHLR